ncbi:MAG TPA: hypothetical protein VIH59_22275 [Candidatus Tectomicrobia bacterium]
MRRIALPWQRLTGGFLIIMLLGLSLQGCAGLQQNMGQNPGLATTLCGAGGALAGAAAGAALSRNNPGLGALLGAVAGGVVAGATCFTIAQAASRQIRDYSQTQQTVGYRPNQGIVTRVDQLSVDPPTIAPKQDFTLHSQYVVMTPNQSTDLQVVETVIVSAYDEKTQTWKEMGRPARQVTIAPGTRQYEQKLTMPANPPSQRFLVAFQVAHENVTDQKSQELLVRTGQASLPVGLHYVVVEVQQEGSGAAGL